MDNNQTTFPQAQPATQGETLSFHDRAAIVARDVLFHLGLNEAFVHKVCEIAAMVDILPGLGPLAQIKQALEPIKPILEMVKRDSDPGTYIKAIPEERILHFVNQIIARLEWVKYGNEGHSERNETEIDEPVQGKTADSTAN